MKVYLANTTRQIQDFGWRQAIDNKLVRMSVDVGQQVQLPGDWTPEDVAYMEKQHRRYGLIRADEIDRSRDFIGMCFSVDKAIDVNRIRYAMEVNQNVLEDRGRTLRQHAAVAAAGMAQQAHPDAGLTGLEMTIQEVRADGGAPAVNEGIRVPMNGQGAPPPAAAGRRRRAAG